MAHDRVNVVCDDMCFEEGMTREQINALFGVGSVTTEKLANESVTGEKIANNTITSNKMKDFTFAREQFDADFDEPETGCMVTLTAFTIKENVVMINFDVEVLMLYTAQAQSAVITIPSSSLFYNLLPEKNINLQSGKDGYEIKLQKEGNSKNLVIVSDGTGMSQSITFPQKFNMSYTCLQYDVW